MNSVPWAPLHIRPSIKKCLLYPSTFNPLPKTFFFCTSRKYVFAPFSSENHNFPIMQQWKKNKYAKNSFPTYLPNQKIQGRGTANKQVFKDGLTVVVDLWILKILLKCISLLIHENNNIILLTNSCCFFFLFDLCACVFNVAFNNLSVLLRRCLVVTGNSVLSHWSILKWYNPVNLGRPVLALPRNEKQLVPFLKRCWYVLAGAWTLDLAKRTLFQMSYRGRSFPFCPLIHIPQSLYSRYNHSQTALQHHALIGGNSRYVNIFK